MRQRIVITVAIGENYMEELRERLHKHHISQGELAREMSVSPTVLTRWFNTTSKTTGKPMEPSLANVRRIEVALLAIMRKRRKERGRHNGK